MLGKVSPNAEKSNNNVHGENKKTLPEGFWSFTAELTKARQGMKQKKDEDENLYGGDVPRGMLDLRLPLYTGSIGSIESGLSNAEPNTGTTIESEEVVTQDPEQKQHVTTFDYNALATLVSQINQLTAIVPEIRLFIPENVDQNMQMLIDKITEQMQLLSGRFKTVRFSIDSGDNTRMDLTIRYRAGKVDISMYVPSDYEQLFVEHKKDLTDALSSQDIEVGDFDVMTGGGQERRGREEMYQRSLPKDISLLGDFESPPIMLGGFLTTMISQVV